MGLKRYETDLLESIHPSRYNKLCKQPFGVALSFFSFFVLIGVIIWGLFLLPSFFSLSSSVDHVLDSFETLNLTGVMKTNQPVIVGPLTIDTDADNLSHYGLLLSDKVFIIRVPFKTITLSLETFKDLTGRHFDVKSTLFWFVLLLIPYVLFTLYMMSWVSIFFIAVVLGLLMGLTRSIVGHALLLRSMIKACLFASPLLSLTLFIHAFSLPNVVQFGLQGVLYLSFLILVWFAMTLQLRHEQHVMTGKKQQVSKEMSHKRDQEKPVERSEHLTVAEERQLHQQLKQTEKKKLSLSEHLKSEESDKEYVHKKEESFDKIDKDNKNDKDEKAENDNKDNKDEKKEHDADLDDIFAGSDLIK